MSDLVNVCAEEMLEKSRVRAETRYNKQRAYKRRCKILADTSFVYNPAIGYYAPEYVFDYKTRAMRYVGGRSYLQYPRHSKAQKYLKRLTSKRMRRISLTALRGKSNIHHKFCEYWWNLY